MKKFLQVLFPLLTLFSLMFIFSNSLKTSSAVETTKGFALQMVEKILEFFSSKDILLEEVLKSPVVAKIGHLLEYFVFSSLFTFSVYFRRGEKEKEAYSQILFACLFAALADEHLQFLGVGRNPSVSDVMVDFSACLIGYFVAGFVFSCMERRNRKRERNSAAA